MNTNVGLALLLPTLAGLCTVLGGLLGILVRKPGPRFMALTLGFSAGVMLLISFAELLQQAVEQVGFASAYVAFFGGMVGMCLIDVLVPHDFMAEEHHPSRDPRQGKMLRTALFLALGIGIHNFPEGMASFAGTLHDPTLGLAIAVAIALHNIPEGLAVGVAFGAAASGYPGATLAGAMALALGIGLQNFPEGMAVAMPLRGEGLSPFKAFMLGQLSGFVEPLAGVLGAWFVLTAHGLLPYALAFAAGAMIFVVVEELIPEAQTEGNAHLATLGTMIGFVIMMALDVGLG